MRDALFDLGIVVGAVLVGVVFTAAVLAAWHRHEIARLAASSRALEERWRQLGEIWAAIDPLERPVWRLTWPQRTAVTVAAVKAAIAKNKPNNVGRP